MLAAIAGVLPIAVGMLLASVPVVAMAAVLATLNTRAVLSRFTAGWLVGVVLMCAVGLLLADVAIFATDSSAWVAWVRLALGVVVAVLGIRKLVSRIRAGAATGEPSWMATMRAITAPKAFAAGLALGSVNPKSAAITLSAVAVAAESTAVVGEQIAALVAFAVVGSLAVAAPLVAIAAVGERAARPLEAFVGWFARHSDVVLAVVLLALAAVLILNAVGELAA